MNNLQKIYIIFFMTLKKHKDNFFIPFLKFFERIDISPSMLTIISFILGIVSIFFLFTNKIIFIILILLHLLLDGLDGSLARYQKKVSKIWGDIDYYSDHIVLICLIIASAFILKEKQIPILLLILIIINNFVYVFFNQKYEIIAIRMVYVIIAIFSLFFANLITLFLSIINFLIIVYRMLFSYRN
ncbi:CDP-alcohol phosphatidyltransferase family protein [Candidatus Pacearchaeota archaeon]|nr:CDP-alcohol phosphatidyltransferase family protein [Candidatus Pacearchaeota archaeon]